MASFGFNKHPHSGIDSTKRGLKRSSDYISDRKPFFSATRTTPSNPLRKSPSFFRLERADISGLPVRKRTFNLVNKPE